MTPEQLQQQLSALMKESHRNFVIGSGNKASDIEKTQGWSHAVSQRLMKSGEFKKVGAEDLAWELRPTLRANVDRISPDKDTHELKIPPVVKEETWLYEPGRRGQVSVAILDGVSGVDGKKFIDKFNKLSPEKQQVLTDGTYSTQQRAANCHGECNALAKKLWETGGDIERIDLIKLDNFDHVMLVVNQPEGDAAKADPSTWGEKCFFVDPWQDKHIFPASQFKEGMAHTVGFLKEQADELIKYDVEVEPVSVEKSPSFRAFTTIRPAEDHYPGRPSEGVLFEDSFAVSDNVYPGRGFLKQREEHRAEHYKKMEPTLEAISPHAVSEASVAPSKLERRIAEQLALKDKSKAAITEAPLEEGQKIDKPPTHSLN